MKAEGGSKVETDSLGRSAEMTILDPSRHRCRWLYLRTDSPEALHTKIAPLVALSFNAPCILPAVTSGL
jgi:hypothetical protein